MSARISMQDECIRTTAHALEFDVCLRWCHKQTNCVTGCAVAQALC